MRVFALLLPLLLTFALPARLESGQAPSAFDGRRAGTAGTEQPPKEAGTRDLLARIEAYLNGIDSLKARFIQGTPSGETRRGTLSLERPGRLRFDYTDETPRLLVSDGELLTFVDYDVGQVTRWPIDETPLGLLVEEEIALTGDERVLGVERSESGRILLKARDPERPDRGTVHIAFEATGSGLELAGWRVVDGRNRATVVRLREIQTNLALADSLWTFEDPRKLPSQRRRRRR